MSPVIVVRSELGGIEGVEDVDIEDRESQAEKVAGERDSIGAGLTSAGIETCPLREIFITAALYMAPFTRATP